MLRNLINLREGIGYILIKITPLFAFKSIPVEDDDDGSGFRGIQRMKDGVRGKRNYWNFQRV